MWTLEHTALPYWHRPGQGTATLVFSTRRGGVSPAPYESLNLGLSTADEPTSIRENRRRLLASIGLSHEFLATAGQVHGARVCEVTTHGHTPDCDALVTKVPGLALAVTTADCMGLVIEAFGASGTASAIGSSGTASAIAASGAASATAALGTASATAVLGTALAVGAAHSGWRGTAAGMPRLALEAVCALAGSEPARAQVHIGPCIRGCCYEVGEDVAAHFPAAALRRPGAKPYLDLPTVARLALVAAGVPETAIHDTGACTACEPYWYFSHRRDAGRTGRLWGVAALAR